MKLTVINGTFATDHGVAAHRADCKDVAKSILRRDHYTQEYSSKREAWLDYNADFLDEGSGAWEIHFHACTKGLPDGGNFNTETDD